MAKSTLVPSEFGQTEIVIKSAQWNEIQRSELVVWMALNPPAPHPRRGHLKPRSSAQRGFSFSATSTGKLWGNQFAVSQKRKADPGPRARAPRYGRRSRALLCRIPGGSSKECIRLTHPKASSKGFCSQAPHQKESPRAREGLAPWGCSMRRWDFSGVWGPPRSKVCTRPRNIPWRSYIKVTPNFVLPP
jgi:hypothetical protein